MIRKLINDHMHCKLNCYDRNKRSANRIENHDKRNKTTDHDYLTTSHRAMIFAFEPSVTNQMNRKSYF